MSRIEFLQLLDFVQFGISKNEVVEQSSCFVFQNGKVETYNEDVYSCASSPLLEGLHGAVSAKQLLNLLRKMTEEDITVETTKNILKIKGKRKISELVLDKEIRLPVDEIGVPTSWKILHEDFLDGIGVVCECAATKSEHHFHLTCIHIHPEFVEACDNFQLARYHMTTGFKNPYLLKAKYAKNLIALGMSEFSNSKSWIHFKNPNGWRYSCRKFLEEYPDLNSFLDTDGDPLLIPKNMVESIERAEIFVQAATDEEPRVEIEVQPGKLVVIGKSSAGTHKEIKKVKYDGKSAKFSISSKILSDISKKFYECLIGENRLKINNNKWEFVAALQKIDDE